MCSGRPAEDDSVHAVVYQTKKGDEDRTAYCAQMDTSDECMGEPYRRMSIAAVPGRWITVQTVDAGRYRS